MVGATLVVALEKLPELALILHGNETIIFSHSRLPLRRSRAYAPT
jgi:hypothetical protein